MEAAVESAPTVEASAGTARHKTVVIKSTIFESTILKAASFEFTSLESAPDEARTIAPSRMRPPPRRMAPVIPRSRTDEHAVHEKRRPVVAIGCACIRIIWIVAIGANWRFGGHKARTNRCADSHSDLRLRVRQWNHQHHE